MLSREIIRSIIVANKMAGSIETGQRFWVCDFYTLSFYHKHYESFSEFKKLLEKSELSNSPIEKTPEALTERIEELVDHLYKIQSHDI